MTLALQDIFPEAYDLRPHHMSLADVKGKQGGTRIEQISRKRTRLWDSKKHKRSGMTHAAALPTTIPHLVTGDECIFTVVRNPYDYFVSCFCRRGQNKSFEDFVKNYHEDPYVRDGKLWYHLADVQEVLRHENLQDELNAVMARLELPEVPLERHNETKDKEPWESYYSPEAFKIVNERFGSEIERFYEKRSR